MMHRIFAFTSLPTAVRGPRWRLLHPSSRSITTYDQGAAQQHHDQAPVSHHQETSDEPRAAAADRREPPLLLLEGDEFFVSHDGIARTLYSLNSSSIPADASSLVIEERYDLQSAQKTFVVRNQEPFDMNNPSDYGASHVVDVLSKQTRGIAPLGRAITSIDIQEIDQQLFSSVGTGGTTWEASLAMAMYFSSHADQLQGDVVEVGCGVGLGGILSSMGSLLSDQFESGAIKSVTLTDGNERILEQCKQNLRDVLSGMPGLETTLPPIHVSQIDWGEFIDSTTKGRDHQTYNTVVACDCAYLHTHVEVLSRTVQALLSKNESSAKIHMFGPYNRSALHEVIRYLQDELDMSVCLEWVEMERYRLKPGSHDDASNATWNHSQVSVEQCAYASKGTVKFLHVTAAYKTEQDKAAVEGSFADIDV